MKQSDYDYYHARLSAEENAARTAIHPSVARIHREMAEHYAALLVADDREAAA